MENLVTAGEAVKQGARLETLQLERQLETTRRRYAEACAAADQARSEWRELTVLRGVSATTLQAARARFEAVAARCLRLRALLEDLEDKVDV